MNTFTCKNREYQYKIGENPINQFDCYEIVITETNKSILKSGYVDINRNRIKIASMFYDVFDGYHFLRFGYRMMNKLVFQVQKIYSQEI